MRKTTILSGRALVEKIKPEQKARVEALEKAGAVPKLMILRDSDAPVIKKYTELKIRYGAEIRAETEDVCVDSGKFKDFARAIRLANRDSATHGIIVQLPLGSGAEEPNNTQKTMRKPEDVQEIARKPTGKVRRPNKKKAENAPKPAGRQTENIQKATDRQTEHIRGAADSRPQNRPAPPSSPPTDLILALIAREKDVDGLNPAVRDPVFFSATAVAIDRLVRGYGYNPGERRVAVVGYGRLVGRPLAELWQRAGVGVKIFDKGDDLRGLRDFNLIVTGTGVPRLIGAELIAPGTVLIDAGTASENGTLVGDVAEEVRERANLEAITPRVGGVGPLTVAMLFEQVIRGAERDRKDNPRQK